MTLDIRVAATVAEAQAALADGYEPVECSYGPVSVVGPLGLDHHGSLSERPPVCRQAHAAYWGGPEDTVHRFVVRGAPDADATLAIAWLSEDAGVHPSDQWPHLMRLVAAADLGQWSDLTQEGRAGAIVLAWGARQRARGPFPALDLREASLSAQHRILTYSAQSARWVAAVQDWADLLAAPYPERESDWLVDAADAALVDEAYQSRLDSD